MANHGNRMVKERVAGRLDELRRMQAGRDWDAKWLVLETALFIEDAFGIVLVDSEIDAAYLGPDADLAAFVEKKLEER